MNACVCMNVGHRPWLQRAAGARRRLGRRNNNRNASCAEQKQRDHFSIWLHMTSVFCIFISTSQPRADISSLYNKGPEPTGTGTGTETWAPFEPGSDFTCTYPSTQTHAFSCFLLLRTGTKAYSRELLSDDISRSGAT